MQAKQIDLSKIRNKQRKEMDEFIESMRPKVIREYWENGIKIKVYESAK